jgi:hypothetical protein
MRIMTWAAGLVAATSLVLACSTSSNETATPMDPACERACDETYQACFEVCKVKVDNTQCEEECLSALRHCTDGCS